MKKLLSKKAIFVLLITILLVISTTTSFANTHEHTLSRMTSIMYSEYNSEKHIASYATYDYCFYCEYRKLIDKDSGILPHDLSMGNYHGTGTTHHVVRYCNICPYDGSHTYTCSGNPCMHPNSVNFKNVDNESLKEFKNELNSIFSEIKENSNTDNLKKEEIEALEESENKLDSLNLAFSNSIRESSNIDNYKNEDNESLKEFKNELNTIFSEIKENSNTDNLKKEEIEALEESKNKLDSLNSIFSNLIKKNLSIDNFKDEYINSLEDFKNNDIEKTSCTDHKLNRYIAFNFDDLGPLGHRYTYIEYVYCDNCNYIKYIEDLQQKMPHNLSTGNYHGAGTTHHVIKYCNDCPYDDSYTYTCPGNPCIAPLSVD